VSLHAALDYASRKRPVFAVNGKKPITEHGFKDATTDPEAIRRMWGRRAKLGVATPTGDGLLVLDVDPGRGGDDALSKLEREHGPLPPTVESVTGGGGRHLYFRTDEAVSGSNDKVGIGLDVKADGGYAVLPPSPHPSGGRYEWRFAPDERPIANAPAWLIALLREDRRNGSEPPIGEEIPKGRRNSALTSLAGSMRRPGMGVEAMEAALLVENRNRCKPPLPEPEVRKIAASVGQYAPAEAHGKHGTSGAPKLRVLDTRALLTTPPPPLDWLADGVFCRGRLSLPGGREKRGKSLVQLVLGLTMAAGGGQVAGITVKPGKVLLIDGENGEDEIHRRLRAVGLDLRHSGNFTAVEARGFDLRRDLAEVARLATGFDLVLLDSFRALWRGDERDEAEVAAALDPLRQLAHDTATAYALTHHAQKGGDEYRGSSAIGACVDWCVMLDRVSGDPEGRTRRKLSNPLARFAPERDDRWLSIRSGGDDGPVSLVEAEPYVPERESPVRDQVEADLLAYVEGVWGVASSNGDHTTTPPRWTGADLARAIGRHPKGPDHPRGDQATRRARRALPRRRPLVARRRPIHR
jgi:hypothetical protein